MKVKLAPIIVAVCEALVGVLLLVSPARFTAGIITALGALLILGGIVAIVRYFRGTPAEGVLGQGLAKGLVALLAGLFCVLNSSWFLATSALMTMLYGLGTLILGIGKVETTVDLLRLKNKAWMWSAIGAAVTILCAGIILLNPFRVTSVLWTFTGVSLIAEAVLDLLAVCLPDKLAADNPEKTNP